MSSRHEWQRGHISDVPWQVDEIKNLNYFEGVFNDPDQFNSWTKLGHQPRSGLLYDMRFAEQPATTKKLIDAWSNQFDHIGVSYYKMRPGDNLPYHSDTYSKYVSKFDIGEDQRSDIWRYIFFVEDQKPGHILEIDGTPIINWRKGDWVAWKYDAPHMAANLGTEDRYTIQLTGLMRR